MDDDLNTPVVIATLFEAASVINKINDGSLSATQADIDALKSLFSTFLFSILGIMPETAAATQGDSSALAPYEKAVDLLLEVRAKAKAAKDWATSDLIRDRLNEAGFDVKDTKDGFEWSVRH